MSIYDSLNENQKEAVFCTEGPLLILAGAGSGKTRVLTHRIAYLISECGVNPYNIMAITFTNKAAGEMRERVDRIVDFGAESIWVSTFHSACVKILRRYIDRLGYDNNFTIYDTDDQKQVVKEAIKNLDYDPKYYKEGVVLSMISSAKNELKTPADVKLDAMGDFKAGREANIYEEYQKLLKKNNALDFDDLIFKTVELLRVNVDVLEYYQNRFKYIIVDEYQDTNTAQFKLVHLLANKYKNICVVGDDDQSIYKFRGANIGNILNFEKYYSDARVIKLEQNYRSTGNILNVANAVIKNNISRKDKSLWCNKGEGGKVIYAQYDTAYEEADGIASDIAKTATKENRKYSDYAILYRTNAQSRILEEKCILNNIPYRIYGGQNFYQRKEIKDILAYLKTIDNARDELAIKRIINVPKRGIGATSIAKISDYAIEKDMGFYDALKEANLIPGLGKTALKIEGFTNVISVARSKAEYISLKELVEDILETTQYLEYLKESEDELEYNARKENIDEFITKVVTYEENAEDPNLSEFLEEVSLIADIDNHSEDNNVVSLMTLHSAKGLEFPVVYLSGMEDGLFPSYMSITEGDASELEEERRLCYVGITRAMEKLVITSAKQRMVRGETRYSKVSRFVNEIPKEFIFSINGKMPREQSNEPVFEKQYATKTPPARTIYTATQEPKNFGTVDQNAGLSYEVGDRVKHIRFGEGTVINIVKGGRDYEVTVTFDAFGTKKMFAAFANLSKCI
ncbi:MAG: UvrD-helicase domain-containing protein [Lachnospiraceae bacterium]|nr:UvrD-helicase domain-containing protein [Lachnospiraceae bacterium]